MNPLPSHTARSANGTEYRVDFAQGLPLDSGATLAPLQLSYRCYGELNAARDNAIVVVHALSGSAALHEWWPELIGTGRALDPARHFILCCNLLGSCYGSSGPLSPAPAELGTGVPYQAAFPKITVRDQVRAQQQLITHLGINRLHCLIGPSLGGMIALEWALLYPEEVGSLVLLATTARHSAQALALSELQRNAIRLDPDYGDGFYHGRTAPIRGLSLARQLAHIGYRSPQSLQQRFGRQHSAGRYEVCAYLAHQGEKFCARFDANSYIRLSECMNSHDIGRDRGGVLEALRRIEQPTLIVGIDSDQLYPLAEQAVLAQHMNEAELVVLESEHGHDGFLLEHEAVNHHISRFLGDSRMPVRAARAPESHPARADQ